VNSTASDTYLLPHVAPDGTVYTSITNFPAKHGFCCITVSAVKSVDGGKTWQFLSTAISNVPVPAFVGGYANTTFTDGIDNTFAVGLTKVKGQYPLYIAYNEHSTAVANVLLTASYDGGMTWTTPIRVNDNQSAVDEFQPNVAAAANGTISRQLLRSAAGLSGSQHGGSDRRGPGARPCKPQLPWDSAV